MNTSKRFKAHEKQYAHRAQQAEGEEIICSGSDAENSPKEIEAKHLRYERQAQRCLRGKIPILQSASLRGPFNRDWINPWRYQPTATIQIGRAEETVSSFLPLSEGSHIFGATFTDLDSQLNRVEAKIQLTARVEARPKTVAAPELEDTSLGLDSESERGSALISPLPQFELKDNETGRPLVAFKTQEKQLCSIGAVKRPVNAEWLKRSYMSKRGKWDSPTISSPTPVRTLQVEKNGRSRRQISHTSTITTEITTSSILSNKTPLTWEHNAQHVDTISPPDEFSTPMLPFRGFLSEVSRESIQVESEHRFRTDRRHSTSASKTSKTITPALHRPIKRDKKSPAPYRLPQLPHDQSGSVDNESMADVSFVTEVAPSSRNLEKFQFRKKRKRTKGQVYKDADDTTMNASTMLPHSTQELPALAVNENVPTNSANITPRLSPRVPSGMANEAHAGNNAMKISLPEDPATMANERLHLNSQNSFTILSNHSSSPIEIDQPRNVVTSRSTSYITPTGLGTAGLPVFDFEGGEAEDYMLFDTFLRNNPSTPVETRQETKTTTQPSRSESNSNVIYKSELHSHRKSALAPNLRVNDGNRKAIIPSPPVVMSCAPSTHKKRSSPLKLHSPQSSIASRIAHSEKTPPTQVQEPSYQTSASSKKKSQIKNSNQVQKPPTQFLLTSRETTPERMSSQGQETMTQNSAGSRNTPTNRVQAASQLSSTSKRTHIPTFPSSYEGPPGTGDSTKSFNTTPSIGSSMKSARPSPMTVVDKKYFDATDETEQDIVSLCDDQHVPSVTNLAGEPQLSTRDIYKELGTKVTAKGKPAGHYTILVDNCSASTSNIQNASGSQIAGDRSPRDGRAIDGNDNDLIHFVPHGHHGTPVQSDPQSPWGPTEDIPIFCGPKTPAAPPYDVDQPEIEQAVATPVLKSVGQPFTPRYGIEFLKSLMAPTPKANLHDSPSANVAIDVDKNVAQNAQQSSRGTEEVDSGWQPFEHPLPVTPQYHGITPLSELMPPTPPEDSTLREDDDLPSTQLLVEAATNNPWTNAFRNPASKISKRVSWIPGAGRTKHSSSPKRQESPPPPELANEENVHDSTFENHFIAATRANSSSKRIQILNSSSPPVDATARAFIVADRETSEDIERQRLAANTSHLKIANGAKTNISPSPFSNEDFTLKDSPCPQPTNVTPPSRTIDYNIGDNFNEFFGENGGILEEWSVEAELKMVSRPGPTERSGKKTARRGGKRMMLR